MEELGIQLFIILTSGLSILLIAWALFVKFRENNFESDFPKQFLTNSVPNLRASLLIILSLLIVITLTTIFKNRSINELFTNENLLLIVPIVLSFIIVYFVEPLSRK